MMPIFRVLDFATIAFAAIALITTLAAFASTRCKVGKILWLACLLGASGLGIHHALVRSPKMVQDVQAYWLAAHEGDEARASEYKAVFDEVHPRASAVLKAESALLLLAIAGWLAASPACAPKEETP